VRLDITHRISADGSSGVAEAAVIGERDPTVGRHSNLAEPATNTRKRNGVQTEWSAPDGYLSATGDLTERDSRYLASSHLV
jgi:hypothetical protein